MNKFFGVSILLLLALIAVVGAFLYGVKVGAERGDAFFFIRSQSDKLRSLNSPSEDGLAKDRVHLVGDSLIARGDWRGLKNASRVVVNFGRGGITTGMLENQWEPVYADCQDLVLWIGTNDLMQSLPVPSVLEAVGRLLDKAAAAHGQVFVMALPHYSKSAAWAAPVAQHFNDSLRELVTERGAVFVATNQVLGVESTMQPQFSLDGVHLTMEAYAILTRHLRELMEENEPEKPR
ncbi:MAG: GDSL-type esterase/lipase family protein [Verrucomicrobiota bacterium]